MTDATTWLYNDEDLERAVQALSALGYGPAPARAVLDTIGPIIERERQAAKEVT